MSENWISYRDWYETLSSEDQKKHKSPDELLKAWTEPASSLASLPTAMDYMEARFQEDIKIYRFGKNVYSVLMEIAGEAENRRIDYSSRASEPASVEAFGYWKGRRDEAGHFRDRLIALLESFGK